MTNASTHFHQEPNELMKCHVILCNFTEKQLFQKETRIKLQETRKAIYTVLIYLLQTTDIFLSLKKSE